MPTQYSAGFPLGFRPENVNVYEEVATTIVNGTRPGFCNGILVKEEPYLVEMTSTKNTVVDDGICPTLTARMGTGGNQVNAVCCVDRAFYNQGVNALYQPQIYDDGTCPTVIARGPAAVVTEDINIFDIRRLTPTECERLQGYPQRIMWDVYSMTKDEYIAWNIAEKNIIVDTEKGIVYGTRGPGGIPYKEPKELKGTIVNGYRAIGIRNGGTKLNCRVNRVVWIAQNGIIPEGYVVDHINNDKLDNRIENLQLLTPADNSSKAKADGLYKEGLDNKACKIDPALHDEIAYLHKFSGATCRELAKKYGVSKSRIGQIIKEIGWTEIGEGQVKTVEEFDPVTGEKTDEYTEWEYFYTDQNGKRQKASDSARYKALGNSICTPFWYWLIKRISAQYERVATLGSLFDGISGFPLCWGKINGPMSCRWASEIEPFPSAVCRQHFGDEDLGIEGDFYQAIQGKTMTI